MSWSRAFCYYLAAFAGGALAWGASYYCYKRWGSGMSMQSEDPYYLIVSLVPILQNALPQLLAAIVLHVAAKRLAWTKWWQWVPAGVAISLAVVYGFNRLGQTIENARLPLEWQSLKMSVFFMLMGPIMASLVPLWVPLVATGAASLMLWAVGTSVGRRRL